MFIQQIAKKNPFVKTYLTNRVQYIKNLHIFLNNCKILLKIKKLLKIKNPSKKLKDFLK